MNFYAALAGDQDPSFSEKHPKPVQAHAEEEPVPMWRPSLTSDGRGGQRVVVAVAVIGIQAFLILGLAAGLVYEPAPVAYKPLEVALLPEEEAKAPPPPPPKPILMQPRVTTDAITLPQIYVPPPLVQVTAPPSPITATTTPPVAIDPDIAIQDFQRSLLRLVNRNLRYPPMARTRRFEGIVTIKFTMDRRGYVSNVAVHEPSAFEVLNHEGIAVLLRAQPFPPPPPELKGERIEMILPVKFSLREAGGAASRHRGETRDD